MQWSLPTNATHRSETFRRWRRTDGRGWRYSCARTDRRPAVIAMPIAKAWRWVIGRGGKKEPRQSSGAEFEGGESSRC